MKNTWRRQTLLYNKILSRKISVLSYVFSPTQDGICGDRVIANVQSSRMELGADDYFRYTTVERRRHQKLYLNKVIGLSGT